MTPRASPGYSEATPARSSSARAAGLATTAVAMSVMQTLGERHGPAPLAFLLIPVMGAFLIDIANALTIQGFLALPWFTW